MSAWAEDTAERFVEGWDAMHSDADRKRVLRCVLYDAYARGADDQAGAAVRRLPAEPPEGYVRVRVAVCVNDDGDWNASKWRDDVFDPGDVVTWVTADVPKPQPPAEVVGHVEGES